MNNSNNKDNNNNLTNIPFTDIIMNHIMSSNNFGETQNEELNKNNNNNFNFANSKKYNETKNKVTKKKKTNENSKSRKKKKCTYCERHQERNDLCNRCRQKVECRARNLLRQKLNGDIIITKKNYYFHTKEFFGKTSKI